MLITSRAARMLDLDRKHVTLDPITDGAFVRRLSFITM
jgi:hypothetical protein